MPGTNPTVKTNIKKRAPSTECLGLYDILGNVAEWTLDQYDAQYLSKLSDTARDPIIPPASAIKNREGWILPGWARTVEAASRAFSDPSWNKRDPQFQKPMVAH
jgi:formylglycine-generating enzyme required for sulfatase activity